ncbi:MAG: PcfJ domain-containing protein [Alphaproteobacteria bacterium]|nr:PcfJ domain-containing protein [Alphaproteobacteria bacterium]
MAFNLLNDKDFNNYLTDITYQGGHVPNQQSLHGEFESVDYVEQHRDEIVKGILNQYIKLRVREYLLNQTNEPAFVKVDKTRADLPGWTARVFDAGEDVYEFHGAKMSDKLRDDITMVRDFLYDAAGQYVDKIINRARETDKKPTINYAFLKTTNEYDTFDKALEAAKKWHENMAEEMAKRNKNKEFLAKSLVGTKHVMTLSNGMLVYELTTPGALDFESDNMGHCVGRGAYDNGVAEGSIKIYSIRDARGEPHATLEVRDNKVIQLKGKANKMPKKQYALAAREFVEKQHLNITHDKIHFGFICIDGEDYDLFDLPKKLVVDGDLNLSNLGLSELPDLSEWEIRDDFYCSDNQLTSLAGAPQKVGGDFECSGNQLTSLNGAPEKVGGYFDCSRNQLTSLNGAPEKVGGDFDCSYNQLTSLNGAPKEVAGSFECLHNQLTSLNGAPEKVGGNFYCSNNQLTSLNGAPEKVGGDFYCSDNQLTSLNGAPKEVGGDFFCSDNQLTTLNGAPEKVGGNFNCSYNQLTSLNGAPKEVGGYFDCSQNQLTSLNGAPKEIGGKFICDSHVKKGMWLKKLLFQLGIKNVAKLHPGFPIQKESHEND